MKIKNKSVVFELNEYEKRSLGRLTAHLRVGAIGSDTSPVDCHDVDCDYCPFNTKNEVAGYKCRINQIVYLKCELAEIVEELNKGHPVDVTFLVK